MKVRFLADADLNRALVTGLRRREPSIEFATAADGGILDLPDDRVLEAAADHGLVLVSHDKRTMPRHFGRLTQVRDSPGVLIVMQDWPVAAAIDELLPIWTVTDAEEWINRIAILPV